jgi:hypothetical protein
MQIPDTLPVAVSLAGNPGTVLPNGAYVIASKGSGYSEDTQIILCMWIHGSKVEYVTWIHNKYGCEWGHYYDNITAAVEDFRGRS